MCNHKEQINAIRTVMSTRVGFSAGDRGPIERALSSIEQGKCEPHETPEILRVIASRLRIQLPLQGDNGAL